MNSVDYYWYKYHISQCRYLDDADALMDEAAEDPSITTDDFIDLTCYVRSRIDAGYLM